MEKINFNPATDCLDELISLIPDMKGDLFDDGLLENHMCIFEKIYYESPNSSSNGVSSIRFRSRLGRYLSPSNYNSNNVVVVPVPNSGRSAASGYAHKYGYKLKEGFIKKPKHTKIDNEVKIANRTFIAGEVERKKLADDMYDTVPGVFKNGNGGKHAILIDDSIVRGTTISRIIIKAFDAGAETVDFKSSAPPLKYPCYGGIDMKKKTDFIAMDKNLDEIYEEVFRLCCKTINEKKENGLYNEKEALRKLSKINHEHINIEYMTLENLVLCADSFYLNKKERWCLSCLNGVTHLQTGNQKDEFEKQY
ncbi:MAG TPA: hypothetical protein VI790_02835 [Candidatus Nanoarchaeia archaeon]|nr:hypothetical protein [Candidatus Nanoarchaeia archaeon]